MAYPNKADKELVLAFASLKSEQEVTGFLRDLLTPAEIEEFSRRFQIAKLLWTTKLPYIDIAQKAGTSTTTVTRVAQWLYKENWKGYRTILQRKYGNSKRIRSICKPEKTGVRSTSTKIWVTASRASSQIITTMSTLSR